MMKANNNPEMSMVNPSTDTLMTKVDSRYGLVVCASKRARQLLDGEELKEIKSKSTKNVTNALEEIAEGKISYKISKADL
ncbi:DNA-directed RNA polymerase subunit omega [Selenomonas montiformis]|nr:DNA-directed RNA polymerase subunit omega [Selenomonas montiformis]MDY4697790.1 DNA-directed RNA polymerase subunit omega [Selenomonas montiformis]